MHHTKANLSGVLARMQITALKSNGAIQELLTLNRYNCTQNLPSVSKTLAQSNPLFAMTLTQTTDLIADLNKPKPVPFSSTCCPQVILFSKEQAGSIITCTFIHFIPCLCHSCKHLWMRNQWKSLGSSSGTQTMQLGSSKPRANQYYNFKSVNSWHTLVT